MINWESSVSTYAKEPPSEKDRIIPITCPVCGASTDSEIISKFVTKRSKYVELPSCTDMVVHNFFLRCTRCSSAILLMWSYGNDHNGISAGRMVYPLHTDAFEIKEMSSQILPVSIYEDLKQAELSFYVGAYYGAGLLLRSACQNICRDKQAIGKNLNE